MLKVKYKRKPFLHRFNPLMCIGANMLQNNLNKNRTFFFSMAGNKFRHHGVNLFYFSFKCESKYEF